MCDVLLRAAIRIRPEGSVKLAVLGIQTTRSAAYALRFFLAHGIGCDPNDVFITPFTFDDAFKWILLEIAVHLVESGQYGHAEAALDRLVSVNGMAEAVVPQSRCMVATGRTEKAIDLLTEHADNCDAAYELYCLLRKKPDAWRLLIRAAALGHAGANNDAGVMHIRSGHALESIPYLSTALQNNFAPALVNMAIALIKTGQEAKGVEFLVFATTRDPDTSRRARELLGLCHLKGIGCPADPSLALHIWQTTENSANAMLGAAYCHSKGLGVSQNKQRARDIARRSGHCNADILFSCDEMLF